MSNFNNDFVPLKILNWNANGINNKTEELKQFIIDNQIDICLITETHARACNKLNFPNFITYRTDRIRGRRGGTAILAKRSLNTSLHSSINDYGFEATTIILKHDLHTIFITAIYNPPKHQLSNNNITSFLRNIPNHIVGGDLNAKHTHWGCNTDNKNGEVLLNYIMDNNYKVIAPIHPTHYPYVSSHTPDILDIFITNTDLPINATTFDDLSSDHLPVISVIGINNPESPKIYKKTNWDLFYNILHQRYTTPPLNNHYSSINQEVLDLQETLLQAQQQATTTTTRSKNLILLPAEILNLIKRRNHTRKKWQQTRNPEYKTIANSLNKQINQRTTALKLERWNKKVQSLCTEDSSIWRMSKTLRTDKMISRPIHDEMGLVYTDEEKAETFADSLERQFRPNEDNTNEEFEDHINNTVNSWLHNTPIPENNEPTDGFEISRIIKRTKIRKAPGMDGITNLMLKNLPPPCIEYLATIINKCFAKSFFPSPWKRAEVILFPKPGKDPVMTSSYRPISLLPALGKVFERIIYNRLLKHFNKIPDEQFGFMPSRSTTGQLTRIIEFIGEGLHKNLTSAVLMLDVAKAFDRVYHKGLIYKLIELQIEDILIHLLHSYLQHRSFVVRYGKHHSSPRCIEAGVPQGSILGPILYLFYTQDFPKFEDDRCCRVAFYADDTAIITQSMSPDVAIRKLKDKTPEIEEWCEKWKVSINGSKSNILPIRRKKRNRPITTKVHLFGEEIPIVKQAKYLGLTLTDKLTWNTHVKTISRNVKVATFKLYPLIGRNSKLPLLTKKLLYTSTIRPLITYAAPAWYLLLTERDKKTLQTLQNKILRTITNATRYTKNTLIHKDLKIDTLEEHITKIDIKFFTKNTKINTLLHNAFDYEIIKDDLHTRPFAAFCLSDAILSGSFQG